MAKILYADGETTGRDASRHCLHQFGGILEVDNREVARIDIRMRPGSHTVDLDALAVSGLTDTNVFANPLSQGDGAFKFAQIMFRNGSEPAHLYGWNVKFDEGFIRRWLGPAYYSYFWSNSTDVQSLASDYLKEERDRLENFKLGTVAKYLGIPVDDELTHDALYDTELMRSVYWLVGFDQRQRKE